MTLASSWASDSAQRLTAEIPPSLPSSPPCRVCYCHHLITQVTGTGQWQPCSRPAAVDNKLPFPNHFLTAHWQTKPPLPANKVNGSRCLLIHKAGMCQSNQEFHRTPLDLHTQLVLGLFCYCNFPTPPGKGMPGALLCPAVFPQEHKGVTEFTLTCAHTNSSDSPCWMGISPFCCSHTQFLSELSRHIWLRFFLDLP